MLSHTVELSPDAEIKMIMRANTHLWFWNIFFSAEDLTSLGNFVPLSGLFLNLLNLFLWPASTILFLAGAQQNTESCFRAVNLSISKDVVYHWNKVLTARAALCWSYGARKINTSLCVALLALQVVSSFMSTCFWAQREHWRKRANILKQFCFSVIFTCYFSQFPFDFVVLLCPGESWCLYPHALTFVSRTVNIYSGVRRAAHMMLTARGFEPAAAHALKNDVSQLRGFVSLHPSHESAELEVTTLNLQQYSPR